MANKITLTINGKARQFSVEGRELLVDLLREKCHLTGTHVGCDTSSCGSCVVMVDGLSVKSCSMPAAAADGTEVLTVEGLSSNGEFHPIQEGFKEEHGLQCGFCTPGMMMTAKDLLAQNPNPTEHEIREALEGNFCRCTGYHNIVRSIQYAAAKMRGEEPVSAA